MGSAGGDGAEALALAYDLALAFAAVRASDGGGFSLSSCCRRSRTLADSLSEITASPQLRLDVSAAMIAEIAPHDVVNCADSPSSSMRRRMRFSRLSAISTMCWKRRLIFALSSASSARFASGMESRPGCGLAEPRDPCGLEEPRDP